MQTLKSFSFPTSRRPDVNTGVWVGTNKISAIGVTASRWITMHGCSINVHNSLDPFSTVIPCGISDSTYGVTTVANELKRIQIEETGKNDNMGGISSNSLSSNHAGSGISDEQLFQKVQEMYVHSFCKIFDVQPEVAVGNDAVECLDEILRQYPDVVSAVIDPITP